MQQRTKISIVALVTGAILLVPLIAMRFTDQVVWTVGDFVFMGVLIFGTGLAFVLISQKGPNAAYRLAVAAGLGAAFLLIWVNGAVGLIGNEDNDANILYAGVLLIGLIGVIVARLRPRGMMYAMYAAAIAQILVPLTAWLIWGSTGVAANTQDLQKVIQVTTFFVVLWSVSALLFKHSTKKP